MKAKYLLILAAVAGLTFTSCDMDLMPEGALEETTAIQSFNDVMRYRNGFYTGARSFCTSQFLTYADIQTDKFNGIVINGNRMGTIANGVIIPSDDDITGYWGSIYGLIANINYFLQIIDPLYQGVVEDGKTHQIDEYARYIGEAHFFRGYYYAMMFDRWCTLYSPEKGDQPGLGLPIVTTYDPTSDRSKYPGRSTMNETIKFFKDEIQMGLEAISKYEEINADNLKPNAPYLSSYAIRAMQARIELWLGNYENAKAIALEVIGSGKYKLANYDNYAKMWTTDTSEEIIFRPFMDQKELSNSIGSSWISTEVTLADYIPSSTFLKLYEEGGVDPVRGTPLDIRYSAYFAQRRLATAFGTIPTMCFTKFPGNKALEVSGPNLMNMPKPFRLSEMYLIVAESAYMLGDETTAYDYLYTLQKNRFKKAPTKLTLAGDALRDAIRNERAKELVGEGFRLSDMRRWHIGFDRSGNANYSDVEVAMIVKKSGLEVVYAPDDHRYTWPIPSDELQSNPQIAKEQNPGY